MGYDELKKKFPEEGHLCKKLCGKCCTNTVPFTESEAERVSKWLCENKTAEQLVEQFHHFDDHPNQCPFLAPDKSCYIYPVRPTVCFMFGHLVDVPKMPKEWSQQCPEGVKFTDVEYEATLPESLQWFDEMSNSMIRSIMFRVIQFEREDGVIAMVPPKPGSAFERMRTTKSCFRCNMVVPEGGKLVLVGAELICVECDSKR